MNEERFDQDFALGELLPPPVRERLRVALTPLLDTPFSLLDAQGAPLPGEAELAGERAPLVLELEPLGFLQSPCADAARLRAAATLVELLLRSTARYKMASRLHLESVRADYEALQVKHFALQESEARYRALSGNLEQRVAQQVQTIENAQRQLYQAEKMASVGQLAAGVAHEINNPIGFIRSNLGTAHGYVKKLRALAPWVKAQDMKQLTAAWQQGDIDFLLQDFDVLLQESASGADRVARIVADLKSFSSVDRAETEIVNLNDSLRSVCNIAAPQLRERAELRLELGELPPLRCHARHLNQVFLNLLRNASQALKHRGVVCLRSRLENGEIVVNVQDDGAGIAPNVLPRVFDPFFTTRDVGEGTGLGLTVCRDIVRAHGGRIEIDSAVGQGTTVTVYLPVSCAAEVK